VGTYIRRGGVDWWKGKTYLDQFEISDAFETGVEEGDLLDFETIDSIGSVDVDAVADVVRMFHKQEGAGAEEFLRRD
jgi:hypothetical protein